MDKYLVPAKDSTSIGRTSKLTTVDTCGEYGNGDMLTIFQNNNAKGIVDHDSLWGSTQNLLGIDDVQVFNRRQQLTGHSQSGWRIIGGKKVYVTFRNGKKVSGEGAEGYKLAISDSSKSFKRKNTSETKSDGVCGDENAAKKCKNRLESNKKIARNSETKVRTKLDPNCIPSRSVNVPAPSEKIVPQANVDDPFAFNFC